MTRSEERKGGRSRGRPGLWLGMALIVAQIHSGCGGDGDGVAPDTTPPSITAGPTADARGDTVEVRWTTNEAATSLVRYGLDPGYGSSLGSDGLVIQHEIVLTGLVVDTTYYYLVESTDASGNGPTASGGSTFVTARTASQLTLEGWERFESGDFVGARALFVLAQSRDAAYPGGWRGGGWAGLRLGDRTTARSDLEEALSLDPEDSDAATGLAVILASLGERQESAEWCASVLDAEGDSYQFVHDPGVTSADLRVLLAENYVYLLELELALEQVRILDPDVEIDPSDPDTWSGHPTYAAALIAEIARLAADFGT